MCWNFPTFSLKPLVLWAESSTDQPPMIDTIKVQIPLTESQFFSVFERAFNTDREQWAKHNLKTGDVRLLRVDGLATTDQHSFHRDIRWDVSPRFIPDKTWLTVELSLPKLFYGDNVRLLYDCVAGLELLRKFLNRTFQLRTRAQLSDPMNWLLSRLDVCYTWRFPDQEHAEHFLKSLSNQRFPYKEPTKRPTSLTFTAGSSSTYSAKFYLKLPEFLKHDAKAMRKTGVPESEIRLREHLAAGLLRFEVTLRQKWLRRNEIETVADAITPVRKMVFDEDLVKALMPFFNPALTASCVSSVYLQAHGNDPALPKTLDGEILLQDGDYFAIPPGQYVCGDYLYNHPGGGFRMKIVDSPLERILQEMLEKMVGKDAQLTVADRVKQKLSSTYKSSTAANLTAFWLFVQKFGSDEALQTYGRDAYYYKKRQLKKAGVSLLEQRENTIVLGKDFFNIFRLEIPSDHVGNKVDDYRNSQSVLNLNEYLNRPDKKRDQA